MPLRSTEIGTSLLRVVHLLGGAVLQLEADVVEEQHRHEAEEDRARRRHVAEAEKPATPCLMP